MPKRDALTLRDRIPVCPHGDKDSISDDLIHALDRLEREVGFDLTFNSGYRCPKCNTRVGGVRNSAHLRGLAVDISCSFSILRFNLLKAALDLGFRRIGIGKTIIHLDVDVSLPQDVIWTY